MSPALIRISQSSPSGGESPGAAYPLSCFLTHIPDVLAKEEEFVFGGAGKQAAPLIFCDPFHLISIFPP
jgi:hypothetical protein